MKIFLSYASEDRKRAEEIYYALVQLPQVDHVFFDTHSLPPGGDYHLRIRIAFEESDAYVFLISPNSTREGRYTLSELALAKARWPKPWGHVLPVMLTPTEIDAIDNYLMAMTILQPTGNVAAEVATAAAKLLTKPSDSHVAAGAINAQVERQRQALRPFLATFTNYWKIAIAVILFGGLPPVLNLLVHTGPPWPDRTGIACSTILVNWALLLTTYALWRKATEAHIRRRIVMLAALFLSSLVVYTIVSASFVHNAPTSAHQVAAGFIIQSRIVPLLADASVVELLKGASYQSTEIWVPWTVHGVRASLLLSWLAIFGSLSALTAAAVLLVEHAAILKPNQG